MRVKLPLLTQSSKSQCDKIANNPPHATLVCGGSIENHNYVVDWLAERIQQKHSPNAKIIEANAVGIDEVREITVALRSQDNNGRIVVLHDFEMTGIDAQNAMLKLLEEPGSDVYFLLAAAQESDVLPTIRSRCVSVHLSAPSISDFQQYTGMDEDTVTAAFHASQGSFPAFQAYTSGTKTFMETAKRILSGSKYEKLQLSAALAKDRNEAILAVRGVQSILTFLLHQSPNTEGAVQKLELCMETQREIRRNGNVKLLLDRLFLAL